MAEKDKDAKDKAEKDGGTEQADPDSTGMSKPDMKRLLKRSIAKPVNCALALGDPKVGGLGLVLLDKLKLPKVLVRQMKEQFPTCRTPCFGTASADGETKVVTFRMNRRVPGLERKIRKSLKGTGFTKVEIAAGAEGEEAEA